MQSASSRPAAGARRAGIGSQWGARVGALLLSLAASACANIGQFGNMTEGQKVSIAFESIDGPPPPQLQTLVRTLNEEAAARQITVVTAGEANYRLRGYVAAHAERGGTAITWAWDVYDANQRRAFRLNGTERAEGTRDRWAVVDEQVLRRIAHAGIEQFAVFASSRTSQAPAVAAAPAPPQRSRTMFTAWLDDWAPEASGIFRIFRRDQPKTEAATETALNVPPAEAVPLPKGRPAPSDMPSEPALAFASAGQ